MTHDYSQLRFRSFIFSSTLYNTAIHIKTFISSSYIFFFLICVILYVFRWKSGVASSLNYVKISNEESPVLIPYPNWEANTIESDGSTAQASAAGRTNAPKATVVDGNLADNSSIISTFRVRVDECDRLWVMDTGLADILGSPKQIAPPALVIFDLNTDKLIRRYTFQPSDIKSETFFANVVCIRICGLEILSIF